MKRGFLLALMIFSLITRSAATTHIVSVANYSFAPTPITNVHPHDTIIWVWVSGTHTTTSTTIPSGAASWDQNLSTAGATFMYVPTVTGTYNYQCTFHVAMGMVGSFTVVSATNSPTVGNEPSLRIYPNPARNVLNFNFKDQATTAVVTLTDVVGRQALRQEVMPWQGAMVDIQNIPGGLYFASVIQGDMILTKEITISH